MKEEEELDVVKKDDTKIEKREKRSKMEKMKRENH